MLSYLSVKNFAIIENIEVTFNEGFTVLTGETGAGKSLLIDAIGLLLGDRASSDVVRTGEERCEVVGIFNKLNLQLKEVCKTLGIETADDELLIKRSISASSNNIIKCNNQTITLQDLRLMTVYLADIHTQHDTKRLINPDMYVRLLDEFDASVEPYLGAYTEARSEYLGRLRDYNALKNQKDAMLEKMDFMRFQVNEIEKENLIKGEEEDVLERLKTLENFDKIHSAIFEASDAFNNQGALEAIFSSSEQLGRVEDYDASVKNMKERMLSAYYELDDLRMALTDFKETLDFDPEELSALQARMHTFETLKRKYKKSVDEIIDYAEKMKHDLLEFEDYDQTLKEREQALKKAFDALLVKSKALSDIRHSVAKRIEDALVKHLEDLALPKARFEIRFEHLDAKDMFDASKFLEQGQETLDFYLSTNVGEPLKPLSKVASGGELSRIMLALKAILTASGILGLIIFDEIDTGISGYVASQVARKMAKISEHTQVLAITHLPQVAAKGTHHAFIYKESDSVATRARFKILTGKARVEEIAGMISTDSVSESALKSAEELLSKA